MTRAPDVAAALRADVDALRTHLELLGDLPPEDRAQVTTEVFGDDPHAQFFVEWKLPGHDESPSAQQDADTERMTAIRKGAGENAEPSPVAVRRPALDSLVHELSPDLDIPTPVEVLQARRNAEALALLLKEFGALTSAQVADLFGSEAKNRSSLAHRRRKEGRLLAVVYRGAVWFPGFQFHEGEVIPVVADVLAELRSAGLGEWEVALWFTARNGWLSDRRPVDLLLGQPTLVLDATRREVAGFDG